MDKIQWLYKGNTVASRTYVFLLFWNGRNERCKEINDFYDCKEGPHMRIRRPETQDPLLSTFMRFDR